MRRTIHSTIILIATTVTTVGYSRGGAVADAAPPADRAQTKTATSAGADPCTLLMKQDAAAALGEAVSGPKSLPNPTIAPPGATASGCEYTGSGFHKVQLIVVRP